MNRLTPQRLERILERAAALRVLVLGDLMLDVYLSGEVSRISPEAPVPVVQVREESVALGGAANVAANVAALGAACDLVGLVGDDPAGRRVREVLRDSAIQGHLVTDPGRPTTTKTRVMARKHQVVRFDREHDADVADGCAAEVAALLGSRVPAADVLVLEDYDKGVLAPQVIDAALAGARAAGIPTVVDPKFRHFFAFGGATVFKPNALELTAALGTPLRAGEDAWVEQARRRVGCEHLLLTLGEDGMILCSAERDVFRIPTVAREVFDVSGAGDTVTACMAVALAAGAEADEAAVLANVAAGIEVGKPGVATVAPDELRAAVAALAPTAAASM